MFRQLVSCAILSYVLVIAHTGKADESVLNHDYEPAHPQRSEAVEVKTEIEYRFGTNSHIYKNATQELKTKIINHSAQQIECNDAGEIRNAFDKPLPVGWLYSKNSFNDTTTSWQDNFDTNQSEHWVLPNVYCNADRVMTAISWMRSGKKGAAKKNKDMDPRFRTNQPPFYPKEIVDNNYPHGVYCDWEGWLFKKKENRKKYIETLKNDELFTMVNVHCHNKRVTFMQHGYAGDNRHHQDASDKPFDKFSNPSSGDGSIGCSWQGWLLKDGTDDTYNDGGNSRWNYEKYFALDERSTGDKDKRLMHGRVINPFCSKPIKNMNGKVSRIRAYCFYSSKWKNRQTCSDLSD